MPDPPSANSANSTVFFNFDAFDPRATTFARWVKRLETAMDLYGCDQSKKTKLLLHYLGSTTYNILCDKLAPRIPEETSYADILKVIGEHFEPAPNEILENYRFNLRRQKSGESCSEFLVELRRLASNCNFGQYLNTALRNQFVFGLTNQRIQSRLLEKKTLTLNEAVNMAVSYETAEKGGEELHTYVGAKEIDSVNKLNFKNKGRKKYEKKSEKCTLNTSNKKKCYRCGNPNHSANECTYKNVKCNFCNKVGHLRKVCFMERKQINNIEEEPEMKVEELLQIEYNHQRGNREKVMYQCKVNGKLILFEIDTGSPVSIINVNDAKDYFPKLKVYKSDTELISYCGTSLECLGFVQVQVATDNENTIVNLYIIRSNRKPLLGREWLRQIKVDWTKVLKSQLLSEEVNRIDTEITPMDVEKTLKKNFPTVFSSSSGKIRDIQTRLYLKPSATPKFLKARRVAFPLYEAVERELDDQVKEGLLVKVEKSEWATPIVAVPKRNGGVRICGDYKVTLNPELLVDKHPIPTIDELFSKVAGGNKFSKIDLSKAYLQLEVHPEDRHLLTLTTHKGLYEPTRLMFGVASAPAKWQRLMEQIVGDIPGVSVFLDDIKITGENDIIHMQRLNEVFKRLDKYNMRVNWAKCELMKESIEYCGFRIDKNGIHRMQDKIDAIQNMKMPANKDDVRAFLGLVNYYGRFVKNLSSITYPLNKLLQKDVEFVFDQKCKEAFLEVKQQMQTNIVLTYYNPKLQVVLAVDASPIGVGAVLSHMFDDGTERPLQFASQTLNKVQQRYSQIDKEAYAVIFGVKKFYQYLYGKKFILVTDNKAIAQIFSPTKGLPTLSATRMQHYAIYLEHFDYEVQFRRSKENLNADALSRLPTTDECKFVEEVDMIENEIIETMPVTAAELREVIKSDEEIKVLMNCLKYGREPAPKDRFGVPMTEFSIQNGCLMRGIRVYIPKQLRARVLDELHTAHFGITKMKSLARAYCWWYMMDKDIEKLVANCSDCQTNRADPKKVEVHVWKQPNQPFERVHVDYAGPFLGKYMFVLVDAFSKWPEVHVVNNITTETTIQKCKEIFAVFGTPSVLVSDHGTQFNSSEFQIFLKNNGICHKQGAPYHPATNGQAERFIQTFKSKLKTIKCTGNNISSELPKILMAYRRAIHPATGKSPSMLMLGRQIKSRLELILPQNEKKQVDIEKTIKQFSVGEKVAARDYLGKDKWKFGRVLERHGELHYKIQLDDQRIWKRHVDQLRKVGEFTKATHMSKQVEQQPNQLSLPYTSNDESTPDNSNLEEQIIVSDNNVMVPESVSNPPATTIPSENVTSTAENVTQSQEVQLRRSTRTRKTPKRFED